ncbi:uncharacterized protein LOC106665188 [Cimex lectularius]|uniref:Uncharacterized protein n=1 Tax=Cimex lectularius TaxID=79782 RepID=A0A8I6TFM9_CIMLE|nr:uncharacterized protein LOC106665188 [Cimex lectularius]
MKWELNTWLKMSEMFLSVTIFGLHSMAAVWWSSTSPFGWKIMSVLTTSCLCGPIIPQMFRNGAYFYTSHDIVKPINVFIVIYCFVSYFAGCGLVAIETIITKERFISRNVDVVSIIFSAILTVLFLVDLISTLKKRNDDDEDDDGE